jgi:hypothetical protein
MGTKVDLEMLDPLTWSRMRDALLPIVKEHFDLDCTAEELDASTILRPALEKAFMAGHECGMMAASELDDEEWASRGDAGAGEVVEALDSQRDEIRGWESFKAMCERVRKENG